MGWQWIQLNHMQAICTSLQEITTPAPHQSDFYGLDALPDIQPIFTGWMPFLTSNQKHQSTEVSLSVSVRVKPSQPIFITGRPNPTGE